MCMQVVSGIVSYIVTMQTVVISRYTYIGLLSNNYITGFMPLKSHITNGCNAHLNYLTFIITYRCLCSEAEKGQTDHP